MLQTSGDEKLERDQDLMVFHTLTALSKVLRECPNTLSSTRHADTLNNVWGETWFVTLSGKKAIQGLLCPSVGSSIHPSMAITLPFWIFLHQTFKLYCLWLHRHNDAKFFRSRSHLQEFCSCLLYSCYSDKASEGGTSV